LRAGDSVFKPAPVGLASQIKSKSNITSFS
jgi:hypothetical protein